MTIDVIYTAWNRLEFTQKTFPMLMENTAWDRVRAFHVFDDGSEDGTLEYLREYIQFCPIEHHLHEMEGQGPVGAMNTYVGENGDSDYFAKVDSDIVMPPGWLDALAETVRRYPKVDVLGCEAGRMGIPDDDFNGYYIPEHARWIGGVGLFKTKALRERPKLLPRQTRFGWTEWQMEHKEVKIAWISPDLALCELQRMPLEPWASYSEQYREKEWEREWPKYHEVWTHFYWGWWQ